MTDRRTPKLLAVAALAALAVCVGPAQSASPGENRKIAGLGSNAVAAEAHDGLSRSNQRSGPLHVTKECSEFTGQAFSFCTITSSNVNALSAGSKVVYLQAPGASSLDSDIVIVVGPGKFALGHVLLDFATGTGELTISGGIGPFSSFHAEADVSYLGGPDWAWDGRYRFGR